MKNVLLVIMILVSGLSFAGDCPVQIISEEESLNTEIMGILEVNICIIKRNHGQDRISYINDNDVRIGWYAHDVVCTDEKMSYEELQRTEDKSYLAAVKKLIDSGYEFTPTKDTFLKR